MADYEYDRKPVTLKNLKETVQRLSTKLERMRGRLEDLPLADLAILEDALDTLGTADTGNDLTSLHAGAQAFREAFHSISDEEEAGLAHESAPITLPAPNGVPDNMRFSSELEERALTLMIPLLGLSWDDVGTPENFRQQTFEAIHADETDITGVIEILEENFHVTLASHNVNQETTIGELLDHLAMQVNT